MEDQQSKLKASLNIKLSQPHVTPGANLDIQITLRNDYNKPLWVNGRLLVNSFHAPKAYREVWLEVFDSDGVQLDFLCKVRAGRASLGDYRVLNPGDNLSINMHLNQCFDLNREGIYTITANYEDGTEDVPPPPGRSLLLRGPIRSPKQQVRVIYK